MRGLILETLRMHPPVPFDSKVFIGSAPECLPSGAVIPPRSVIIYSPYIQGRSRHLWGDDADKFRPERWLCREDPSPFEFTVFNAGPRSCLGKQLALNEMVVVLDTMIRAFRIQASETSVKPCLSLTLSILGGLTITAMAR